MLSRTDPCRGREAGSVLPVILAMGIGIGALTAGWVNDDIVRLLVGVIAVVFTIHRARGIYLKKASEKKDRPPPKAIRQRAVNQHANGEARQEDGKRQLHLGRAGRQIPSDFWQRRQIEIGGQGAKSDQPHQERQQRNAGGGERRRDLFSWPRPWRVLRHWIPVMLRSGP